LNERHDKLFDTLIAHDHLNSEQLVEIRGQLIELEGKVVGLQTEMHQGVESVATKDEVNARFDRLESLLAQVITRLP
jgi:hypothetical protein